MGGTSGGLYAGSPGASGSNGGAPAAGGAGGVYKPPFILGADITITTEDEYWGATYTDVGQQKPLERLLKDHGFNFIRIDTFVNPGSAGGYAASMPEAFRDLAHTITLAKRVKSIGMGFMLDLHYADTWTNPGAQTPPAAWTSLSLAALETRVYEYTKDAVVQLKAASAMPDIVQIGNEITNGILWPVGQLYLPDGTQQWPAFTDLLKAGRAGALEGCGGRRPKIVLHIDKGGKLGDTRWFFDNITAYGVKYDILGQSYYPMWHGSIAELQANLNDSVARYAKPVLLAEVAYPWTFEDGDGRGNIVGPDAVLPDVDRFPATPAGQAAFYEAVRTVLAAVPGGRGLGFVAWEPEWVPGVGWQPGAEASNDNLTQFDFTGHALPSIRAYRHPPRSPST